MQRREFLRKGLALGAAGLLPNIGLSASESFPLAVNEPLASMAMETELVPITATPPVIELNEENNYALSLYRQGEGTVSERFDRALRFLLEREYNRLVASGHEFNEELRQQARQLKALLEELDARRASAT